ncbi:Rho termination factor N-terminal domain-containing protein, partial [Deinococcus sp.]|uniref:Rho termination factor N-terminal domain-containing protein n=1 Tax=Deinococcus sp. TaxID=47478 RepID=UPI00286E80A7
MLPELHLIAAGMGIEQYRKLKKDTLALSILERQAERGGQVLASGFLEIAPDGYGFLQRDLLDAESRTVLVTAGIIKQSHLRTGDEVIGRARKPRANERYGTLVRVEAINGLEPEAARLRPRFDDLIPTFPERQLVLEEPGQDDGLSLRVVDLLVPIGLGQRALIVAPPKAGKTTLLKKIANSIVRNYPDVTVMVLLVDERPEEVTDFRESVEGALVIASTFDEPPQNH